MHPTTLSGDAVFASSYGVRTRISGHIGFTARTGLLAIAVFSLVRVAVVIHASATGDYGAVSLVFVGMIALPWIILNRAGRRRIGIMKPSKARWILLAALSGAAAGGLVFIVFSLVWGTTVLNPFVYIGGTYSSTMSTAAEGDRHIYFAIFALIAITFSPLGEELFYRGFVQQCFAPSLGPTRAALADAGAFSVVHLAHFGLIYFAGVWSFAIVPSAVWLAAMFLSSLLFDRLRALSRSLLGAVVGHAGFNLMMTAIIFYALDLF